MSRQIKFRGWDKDTDRWYFGSYACLARTTPYPMSPFPEHDQKKFEDEQIDHYIFFTEDNDWGLETRKLRATVDRDSVGQNTGLKDKNGQEIYEGDILRYVTPPEHDDGTGSKETYEVMWRGFGFTGRWIQARSGASEWLPNTLKGADEDMEVIGNIHENSELLERND